MMGSAQRGQDIDDYICDETAARHGDKERNRSALRPAAGAALKLLVSDCNGEEYRTAAV